MGQCDFAVSVPVTDRIFLSEIYTFLNETEENF